MRRPSPLCVLISAGVIAAFGCSDDAASSDDEGLQTPSGPTQPSSPSQPLGAGGGSPTASNPGTGGGGGTPAVTTPPPTVMPTTVPTPEPTDAPAAGGAGGGETSGAGGQGGAAGGGGGAGGNPSVEPEVVEREFLSQTGLYSDIPTETLGERVVEYAPRFQLWTDGAGKRRWLYIPEGTQIDTSDIDEWDFPVGTKIWKEFSRDDIRIETRLLEKLPPERASEGFEGWLALAYVWNEDQTDAVATPMGLENAKGTDHDVPNQEACGRCHDMRVEKPLGVSAVQLNHTGPGATLQSLSDDGWLSDPPVVDLTVPGDELEQEVLGYLHANCGHCHRERSPVNSRVSSLRLWLESGALASVEETEAYQALVNQYSESGQGSVNEYRVVGGDPDSSELMRRITIRQGSAELEDVMLEGGLEAADVPMPPLGTELPDDDAVELVRSWIMTLPAPVE